MMLVPQVAWRLNDTWSALGAFLPQRFLFFLIGMMLYLFLPRFGSRSYIGRASCD